MAAVRGGGSGGGTILPAAAAGLLLLLLLLACGGAAETMRWEDCAYYRNCGLNEVVQALLSSPSPPIRAACVGVVDVHHDTKSCLFEKLPSFPYHWLASCYSNVYLSGRRSACTDNIGSVDDEVTLKDVQMSPDPAVSGESFTFTLPATANVQIDGGKVFVSVFYRGIPVHIERDNLCDKTDCPVPEGDFVFKNSQALPNITPPGPYKVKLVAKDQNDSQLFCTNIQFDIVRSTRSTAFTIEQLEKERAAWLQERSKQASDMLQDALRETMNQFDQDSLDHLPVARRGRRWGGKLLHQE
eukprot:SM000093S24406  [mRNA]  locus=s93:127902:129628:+ [translate_table: standard]